MEEGGILAAGDLDASVVTNGFGLDKAEDCCSELDSLLCRRPFSPLTDCC
jgi:hypothetical protein